MVLKNSQVVLLIYVETIAQKINFPQRLGYSRVLLEEYKTRTFSNVAWSSALSTKVLIILCTQDRTKS